MYILTKTIDAIEFAGNKSKLADFLGITRQSLTSWGTELPQSSAQKLFILTNGEIGKQIDEDSERINTRVLSKSAKNRKQSMFYP